MATFNLSRNARVFLVQAVDATTGVIPGSGASITNTGATRTTEITVLDGLSFSQASQSTTVGLSEAGDSPVRGQRVFNTSLDPVEFSFSTYLGPNGTTTVELAERTLWNALVSSVGIGNSVGAGATLTSVTRASSSTNVVTFVHSAYNWTAQGYATGDIINIGSAGAGTTGWHRWCGPAKITSMGPSATAATTTVFEYLTAPVAAAGTTAATVPTTAAFYKSGYFVSQTNATSEAYAEVNTATSDKNQLQKFGMIFKMDGAVYAVDNCVIESASIDFGIDGIATVAWTGKGSALRQMTTQVISDATPAVFSGALTGTAASALAVSHLANKLSTVTLTSNIQGASGTSYTVPITGGNLTIANNATYLTPAALRTVNTPINYFLGARSITGSLSAYLRTGSGNTAQLLTDIIAQGTETKFAMTININGPTGRRAEVIMNGVALQVPSIETADVMTTSINFSAQGYDPVAANNEYDMERTNDLALRVYGQ